jgi:hypothetical protein
MSGMAKTNGYGLKRGEVKSSALKAIIVALFILADIAGYGGPFFRSKCDYLIDCAWPHLLWVH